MTCKYIVVFAHSAPTFILPVYDSRRIALQLIGLQKVYVNISFSIVLGSGSPQYFVEQV